MKAARAFRRGLVAILVGVAPLAMAAAGEGPPRLEVEATEVSFGKQPPSESVEVRFTLRNTGAEPLNVQAQVAQPLRLSSAPESIAPGESGELVVQASLRDQHGPVAFPVELTTDDPAQQKLTLSVSGEVVTYVEVHPGRARWRVTRGEADGTIQQTLRATDGEPFEIVAVDLPHPGLREETTAAEDGSRVVALTLVRDASVGPITGEVVVHTTHPRQEKVVIPVSGFVRPMVAVTPHEIKGEAELREDAVETMRVRIFTTEPVVIAAVEHDLPGVPAAEIIEIEKGRTYQVLLHLPAALPKGRLRGEIRIIPDSDHVPPVIVPFDATIR